MQKWLNRSLIRTIFRHMSICLPLPPSALLSFLFLGLVSLGLVGCGEDRSFDREWFAAARIDRAPSVVGEPQFYAISGIREEGTCTGSIDPSCSVDRRTVVPAMALDVRCPDAACAVRPVSRSAVPEAALARGWSAESWDGVAFYEVTPLAPEATLLVDATVGEQRIDTQQPIRASTAVALDISGWAAWLAPVLHGAPVRLVPSGSLVVGEPVVSLRGGADTGAADPLDRSPLAVEVEGNAVTAHVIDSPTPSSWVRLDAVSPGEATIVVRRRDLRARFTMFVASPDEVVDFRVHENRYPEGFDPTPLERIRTAEVVSVVCLLGLRSGARALGGCGSLQPNAASGFAPLDDVPLGTFAYNLQRVAAPQTGGAISGRVGAAELLLPVVP